MKGALAWALALSVAIGCSEQRAADDDDGSSESTSAGGGSAVGSGSGAGSVSSGVGAGGGAGGGSAVGSGGSAPSTAVCLAACATARDCDLGAGPAWDADNYACSAGHCNYLGCNSDAECQTQGSMVCRTAPDPLLAGTGKFCVWSCSDPSDCALGAGPAWDADNYDCVSGGCIYTGCNSDAECQAQGNYVCRDIGLSASYCMPACSSAADCDLGAGPAWDADNYACTSGYCAYQGCNSNAECTAIGDYVCAIP